MDHFGYLAVFIGSLMEGETALITGAFLAHRGYFEILKVAMITFIAAQSIDWAYFYTGRWHGKKFLHKRPKLEGKLNRLTAWIEMYPTTLMLFYRFLYGVRIPLVIAFGLSSYNGFRFAILSFLGTVLWVTCYATLGYYFGEFLEANFDRIKHYEFPIMIGLIVFSLIIFYLVKKSNNRRLKIERIAEATK
jgi:membrane protein DedA with SNARE-associated domain